jgi:RecA-family ATPase
MKAFATDPFATVTDMPEVVTATAAWPEPVTAADLCAAPPPTPAVLVDGVLYKGGTMLISGPSKAHKTYTMLAQGIAIADGRPWLGFTTISTPVLYINGELQDFAVAHRVKAICGATATKPPAEFHLWNLRGHRVDLVELRGRLADKIERLGAGLVVIDPHYKVSCASGAEENSNDSQGALLAALEGICGLNGAALAISHHFAKGDASTKNAIDRASGGGVFARWGDVMWTFTPHEQDDAMTVEMSLRNFAPVPPFVVRWQHPLWVRDDQLDPAKLKRRPGGPTQVHTADTALAALGKSMLTYSEWLNASGMSESTFRRRKDELEHAGRVERVGQTYKASK